MASTVYYGSARQGRNVAEESLPGKLDLIIDRLHIRDRVKDELVVLKMHTGNHIGYSTVHPVFVRKVVQAVKDGGGQVCVADVEWDTASSYARGYSSEVLGCPIYPIAGPSDKYYYTHAYDFKGMKEWRVGGLIEDATFLIDFAHAKGHPTCGYGGANKNLALGCMSGETRREMHDTMHYHPYWFAEKCPDPVVKQQMIASCPFEALVEDKHHSSGIHLHIEQCNQCGRCLKVAPAGSLKIDPANFQVFPEANAISVKIILSTFAPGKHTHLVLATQMTPECDCVGFTSMPILPDAGIFGSDDIVALDQAVLDMIGKTRLIEENLPTAIEVHTREGHPFQWVHGPLKDPYKVTEYGEKYGLGTRDYELVDVLPVRERAYGGMEYIPAA